MKSIILIIVLNIFNCNSQNYNSITFGKNGVISIPSNWKIHSEEWNSEVTRKAG